MSTPESFGTAAKEEAEGEGGEGGRGGRRDDVEEVGFGGLKTVNNQRS